MSLKNKILEKVSKTKEFFDDVKKNEVPELKKSIYDLRKKLKGFMSRAIGPVDGDDYIGGNFTAALNFTSTLPMFLQSLETVDMRFFVDAANVWGVDYRDNYDDSNKIRSSTGITIDWFTPIGPLNVSLAQPLSQVSTDKTETFQFNLGTTF